MENIPLFRQLISLMLLWESFYLHPSFYRYFGKPFFPYSRLNTPRKASCFNGLLMVCFGLIFLNMAPLPASFVAAVSLRYLYLADLQRRVFYGGAVGFMSYFAAAYIFLFELAKTIDPIGDLGLFVKGILAIDLGMITIWAGLYKLIRDFLTGEGIEYALCNPVWSKWYWIFLKINPRSLFFKIQNGLIFSLQILTGICLWIPPFREIGAYLLTALFASVWMLFRVSILGLIMIALALVFFPPISFRFPEYSLWNFSWDLGFTAFILKGLLIFYIVWTLFASFVMIGERLFNIKWNPLIIKLALPIIRWRPVLQWGVFTKEMTDLAYTIEKIDKDTQEQIEIVYDAFTRGYLKEIKEPAKFFRFIHHHEASAMGNFFYDIKKINPTSDDIEGFKVKILLYCQTLLDETEAETACIRMRIFRMDKGKDHFEFTLIKTYLVDVMSHTLVELDRI